MTESGSWRRHRILARVVAAVTWVTYREVAVDDLAQTRHGPVLLVANHFGGVADALVLMAVLPRRPRVLADDSIWRIPVARQVMEAIGAIPVHRGRGGKGTDNTDMFSATHEALAGGDMVLIFPEGITREEPSIGEVRTGAARIAVGARADGVQGVRIVPAGIHYDDKAAFRSSVYVREGIPIDVDAEIDAAHDRGDIDDRETIDELTALIDTRLRESAPDYDDWREARALQVAAEAFMRSLDPDRPVPIGLRDRLGAWLARQEETDELVEAGSTYREQLVHAGLTDAWAAEGARRIGMRSLFGFVVFCLLVPYAVLGVIAAGVPAALTWLVTRLRLAPAVMSTVMPLAAAVFFGAAWIFWMVMGWRLDRLTGVAGAGILFPACFGALVLVLERAQMWRRGLRRRLLLLRGGTGELANSREDLVFLVGDDVTAALGGEI